jgi:hypothetical protein
MDVAEDFSLAHSYIYESKPINAAIYKKTFVFFSIFVGFKSMKNLTYYEALPFPYSPLPRSLRFLPDASIRKNKNVDKF